MPHTLLGVPLPYHLNVSQRNMFSVTCWEEEQVQIADAHISTSHLVIELEVTTEPSEEPTAWLHDKSLNGTYHNGQNIGKGNKVLARSGDVISFIVAPIQRPDGSYHVADPNLVSRTQILSKQLVLAWPSPLHPPLSANEHERGKGGGSQN